MLLIRKKKDRPTPLMNGKPNEFSNPNETCVKPLRKNDSSSCLYEKRWKIVLASQRNY